MSGNSLSANEIDQMYSKYISAVGASHSNIRICHKRNMGPMSYYTCDNNKLSGFYKQLISIDNATADSVGGTFYEKFGYAPAGFVLQFDAIFDDTQQINISAFEAKLVKNFQLYIIKIYGVIREVIGRITGRDTELEDAQGDNLSAASDKECYALLLRTATNNGVSYQIRFPSVKMCYTYRAAVVEEIKVSGLTKDFRDFMGLSLRQGLLESFIIYDADAVTEVSVLLPRVSVEAATCFFESYYVLVKKYLFTSSESIASTESAALLTGVAPEAFSVIGDWNAAETYLHTDTAKVMESTRETALQSKGHFEDLITQENDISINYDGLLLLRLLEMLYPNGPNQNEEWVRVLSALFNENYTKYYHLAKWFSAETKFADSFDETWRNMRIVRLVAKSAGDNDVVSVSSTSSVGGSSLVSDSVGGTVGGESDSGVGSASGSTMLGAADISNGEISTRFIVFSAFKKNKAEFNAIRNDFIYKKLKQIAVQNDGDFQHTNIADILKFKFGESYVTDYSSESTKTFMWYEMIIDPENMSERFVQFRWTDTKIPIKLSIYISRDLVNMMIALEREYNAEYIRRMSDFQKQFERKSQCMSIMQDGGGGGGDSLSVSGGGGGSGAGSIVSRPVSRAASKRPKKSDIPADVGVLGVIVKNIKSSKLSLQSEPFINNCLKSAAQLFLPKGMPGFSRGIDKNETILPVSNGILRFYNGEGNARVEFIDGYHEFAVSKYSPVVYFNTRDPTVDDAARAEFVEAVGLMNSILDDIFVEADARKKILTFMALALDWRTKVLPLLILAGGGANGKSTVLKMWIKILGDYGANTALEMITRPREDASKPNSALMMLGRLRGTVFSEPQNNERLNPGRIKDLNGQEMQGARDLNAKQTNIRINCVQLFGTNFDPIIDAIDHGTWRRIMYYKCKSQFVYAPNPANRYEKLRKDEYICKLVETPIYQSAFLQILIEHYIEFYNVYGGNFDSLRSETIARETETYRNSQDMLNAFITTRIITAKDYYELFPDRKSVGAIDGVPDEGILTTENIAAGYSVYMTAQGVKKLPVVSLICSQIENSALKDKLIRVNDQNMYIRGYFLLTEQERVDYEKYKLIKLRLE